MRRRYTGWKLHRGRYDVHSRHREDNLYASGESPDPNEEGNAALHASLFHLRKLLSEWLSQIRLT